MPGRLPSKRSASSSSPTMGQTTNKRVKGKNGGADSPSSGGKLSGVYELCHLAEGPNASRAQFMVNDAIHSYTLVVRDALTKAQEGGVWLQQVSINVAVVNARTGNEIPGACDGEDAFVVVHKPNQLGFDKTGKATVCVSFTRFPGVKEGLRFKFTCDGNEQHTLDNCAELVTRPFDVHATRLVVTNEFPDFWYKDQGGKEKSLEVNVQLENEHRHVQNIPYRLKFELCYEDEKAARFDHPRVLRQSDMFKLIEQPNPVVLQDGNASIRARITDVSKNHQKQRFVIVVSAVDDNNEPLYHVCPAVTGPPLIVYSKPSKQKKKKLQQKKQTGMDVDRAPGAGTKKRGGGTKNARPQKRKEPALNADMSNIDALNCASSSSPSSSSPSRQQQLLTQQLGQETNARVQDINTWIDYVVHCLRGIEWQHIGFEVTEDGEQNLRAPIFRCHSCWAYKDNLRTPVHNHGCMVERALEAYEKVVLPHMDTLQMFGRSLEEKGDASGLIESLQQQQQLRQEAETRPSAPAAAAAYDSAASFRPPEPQASSDHANGLPDVPDAAHMANASILSMIQSTATQRLGLSAQGNEPFMRANSFGSGESGGGGPSREFSYPVSAVLGRGASGTNLLSDEELQAGKAQEHAELENTVWLIHVITTPHGFPAFTQHNALTGFYRYDEDKDLVFRPVPKLLRPEDEQAFCTALEEARRGCDTDKRFVVSFDTVPGSKTIGELVLHADGVHCTWSRTHMEGF